MKKKNLDQFPNSKKVAKYIHILHKYITGHFTGLVHALQLKKRGGVKLVLLTTQTSTHC
jgi:hypothetical protein